MSREELFVLLDRIIDPRFAEPIGILHKTLNKSNLKVAISSRELISSELISIYSPRNRNCKKLGIHVPGLGEFVELLMENPTMIWKIISISSDDEVGAVFVTAEGTAEACLVGITHSKFDNSTPTKNS